MVCLSKARIPPVGIQNLIQLCAISRSALMFTLKRCGVHTLHTSTRLAAICPQLCSFR